ncbi:MAG: D-tagatose-bisphosphate aldolase, class II, non-catalytic subunit [Nocardioidaceae bacterium]
MSEQLLDLARRRRADPAIGIASVCSAHPLVVEAAVEQALDDGGPLLVEATSNQVDQFGGYTGMRPVDFRDLVTGIAEQAGLPRECVLLGGDHLGPNRWRALGADEAMRRAENLVAEYVEAGFCKLHLDTSMVCAGDPTPLTDAHVAERAARLARVAEDQARHGGQAPVYVIGTEVPVPGGAQEDIEGLEPTSPEAAARTIEAHRQAFDAAGVGEAWQRVIGLVVQPGVEFDHHHVVDYDRRQTKALTAVLDDHPGMVFEAHSTDYQSAESLAALVEDRWAILKVGPWLTFALREALFALAAIEDELVAADRRSRLVHVVEATMLTKPEWWQDYYPGGAEEQRLARRYSYSDRIRYYWSDPIVAAAQERLLANLGDEDIPLPLISAHLPQQYESVRRGELPVEPRALAIHRVRGVLAAYSRACGGHPARP